MYDLIIIGGGPAGVSAGVYSARKKIKTALITESFGGQSVVSSSIENWIGEKVISGYDLAQKMEAHLKAQTDIDIIEGDRVSNISKTDNIFSLQTELGKSIESKAILIATGGRHKRLEVKGEKEFDGKGVVFCSTCDAPLFGGKDVAVVGGGNAGLESVLDLLPYANKIYLLIRGEVIKGDPVTLEEVQKNSKVEIIYNAEVQEIKGEKFVSGLVFLDKKNNLSKDLDVSGIFVNIGVQPNSSFVKDLVALNERGEIIVNPVNNQTSLPGVWAVGDVANTLYNQNNIASGDAIRALLNISDWLKQNKTA